jgi:hypothetical protein
VNTYYLNEDQLVEGFWSEDLIERRVFICQNSFNIIINLPAIVSARRNALLEEGSGGFKDERVLSQILSSNLSLLVSCLCDGYFYASGQFSFSRGRFAGKIPEKLYEEYRRAFGGLETYYLEKASLSLDLLKRGECETIDGALVKLCEDADSGTVDWENARFRFNGTVYHGACFLIGPVALRRVVFSKHRTKILSALFCVDTLGQIYDMNRIFSREEASMVSGDFWSIMGGLVKLGNIRNHPLALDAFLTWCRLKALYCANPSEIDLDGSSSGFEPRLWDGFLTSVPAVDRRDLKLLILGTAFMTELACRRSVEMNDFVRRVDGLEVFLKQGVHFGQTVECLGLFRLFEGDTRRWILWVKTLVSDNVISPENFRSAEMNTFWIETLFKVLDYGREDIGSVFFRREVFWEGRGIDWS